MASFDNFQMKDSQKIVRQDVTRADVSLKSKDLTLDQLDYMSNDKSMDSDSDEDSLKHILIDSDFLSKLYQKNIQIVQEKSKRYVRMQSSLMEHKLKQKSLVDSQIISL